MRSNAFAYIKCKILFNWEDPDTITTLDLVELISWKGDGDSENEEVAKKAGLIFFHRFSPALIKRAEMLCTKHGRELSDALIIAQRSIRKFIHSDTFSFENSKLENPESAVRAYLNKTAFHELINLRREEKRIVNNPYTGNEKLIYEMNQLEAFTDKPEPIGSAHPTVNLQKTVPNKRLLLKTPFEPKAGKFSLSIVRNTHLYFFSHFHLSTTLTFIKLLIQTVPCS